MSAAANRACDGKDPAPAGDMLGDPDSWVGAYGEALFRFAVLRVGDVAAAEDLVQETFLAAWKGRDRFSGECSPQTWLVAILKRRIADHYRQQGRRLDLKPAAAVRTPGADRPEAEQAEFWNVVSGCTGDLPGHLARAFQLRTFADETPEAICGAEGISRKNLSVRLHRARQLLRRCLETRWFGGDDGEAR